MSAPRFASPASTSLDELVQLRSEAAVLRRRKRFRRDAPRSGEIASRRLGRGLDFAELREYQPGDDVRLIDWKVTARTGRPHTKLFTEERERPVFLVVDFRSAMRFGTRGSYKSVLASRLAAIVGWTAVAARDRVGGVVFTDDWHADIRAQGGRRGLMNVFQNIMHGQNRIPRESSITLADTLERVATVAHPGSSVRIFSDFSGFDSHCARALGGALAVQDVVGVHISDPIDQELPRGRLPLVARSAMSRDGLGRRFFVGTSTHQREHSKRYQREMQGLSVSFSRGRHRLVSVSTEDALLDNAALVIGATNSAMAVSTALMEPDGAHR